MKKTFLFTSVLASLFMAGCSQNDGIAPDDEKFGDGETVPHYMAVNFVSSDNGDALTRAKADFEDGTEQENKISSARFYFFNATGGVAYVKAGGSGYTNYYDWSPDNQDGDKNLTDDIEKKYSALIVINTEKGDKIPQMMAVVLNPTENLKSQGNRTLSQLQGVTNDYASPEFTQEGKFVMFNSVYSMNEQAVSAVAITAQNIAKTEAEAQKNPVKLYVERNVAKVSVEIGLSEEDYIDKGGYNLLKLKNNSGSYITVDKEDGAAGQVYLKLNTWGLTAETDKGRLVKKINPKWTESWVQDNLNPYRSCWAINAMDANNRHYNHTHEATNFGADKYLYTNENAQLEDIDNSQGRARNKIKVKINGLLCEEDGTPITVVRHMGAHFMDKYDAGNETNNLPMLKKSILSQLDASGKRLYTVTNSAGSVDFTQIGKEDIKIKIVNQTESEDPNYKGKNCYVVAELTEAAKAKRWYSSSDKDTYTDHEVNAETIDKYLYDPAGKEAVVDPALVWREGMTYYFYEIMHNKNGNQPGVVRNHVYKTRITGITGLGTPVYDPDKVIYPEKPDENDHYIAAEINILSWHIVNDGYKLEW